MSVQGMETTVADLVLHGKKINADVSGAVTGQVPLKRTISGASSFVLSLEDPNLKMLSKPFTKQATTLSVDGLNFRMVGVKHAGGTTTLTFEDAVVARLRAKKGPKKASRDKLTRAQFIGSLAREAGVPFVSPERRKVQPVGKSKAVKRREADERREPGIDRSANLTVKGAKATRKQIEVAEEILTEAYSRYPKAPQRAVVALLCAATHESVMGTLGMTPATISDHDSVGILQARLSYVSAKNAMDIGYNVRRFMVEPWTGTPQGGAIKQAKAGRSIGDICTSIQGNDTGDIYTQWKDEALAWIDAFGGGSASFSVETEKPYSFEVKKDENYWEAIQRLAKEVNWRAFVTAGKLYYFTDQRLLASRSRLIISPDYAGVGTRNYPPGIDDVSFEIHQGKKTNSVTVKGRAARWAAPPGSVVILTEEFGAASGRWLVGEIARNLDQPDVTIKLRRPQKPLPEPAPKTKTVTARGGSGSSAGAEKAVKWAKAQVGVTGGSAKHSKWMSAVGGSGAWCSFFIGYAMKEVCGFQNIPSNVGASNCWLTWGQADRVSEANIQPGDIVVYGGTPAWTDHVNMYVGNGKCVGGNQSNAVTEWTLAYGKSAYQNGIVGIVRPKYGTP